MEVERVGELIRGEGDVLPPGRKKRAKAGS